MATSVGGGERRREEGREEEEREREKGEEWILEGRVRVSLVQIR